MRLRRGWSEDGGRLSLRVGLGREREKGGGERRGEGPEEGEFWVLVCPENELTGEVFLWGARSGLYDTLSSCPVFRARRGGARVPFAKMLFKAISSIYSFPKSTLQHNPLLLRAGSRTSGLEG